MSRDNEPNQEEAASADLVERALGPFVPTTEAEVEKAEAEGVEFNGELPPSLRQYRDPAAFSAPRSTRIVSIDDARRDREERKPSKSNVVALFSHGAAMVAGAVAAAAILLIVVRPKQPIAGPAGGDTAPVPSETAAPAEPGPIVLGDAGTCDADCCGGSQCARASKDMQTCPSGRTCTSCSREELTESQYRFKLGGLAPSEWGKKALQSGSLDVCVRVAGSDMVCAPAHTSEEAPSRWIELPLVATSGDNLAGVTVTIRYRGAKQALAEWNQIIPVNAAVLCKGLMIEPKMENGESIGALSMFLVDSHYVELGRAADVASLEELRRRFQTKLDLKIFETKQPDGRHFALAAGPFAKPQSERFRWAVLDAGAEAETSVGTDYVGDPRPAN
ncbi:MAG: hypothetical protein HOW73_20070 [Polyangiaceae bacterium]|nr:hypothetical protein [Polyangiaceae bacterium]